MVPLVCVFVSELEFLVRKHKTKQMDIEKKNESVSEIRWYFIGYEMIGYDDDRAFISL